MNGLETEFGDNVNFYRLNAGEPEVLQVQQTFGLRGHPSAVILDENDNVMVRYFGPETFDTLQAVLTGLLE